MDSYLKLVFAWRPKYGTLVMQKMSKDDVNNMEYGNFFTI